MKKYKFVIRYKSGAEVAVEAQGLTVKSNTYSGLMSLEWEDMSPIPMRLGVDDIESVWQVI